MYKYKKIRLKDRSSKDEHRIIMEKRLGRKLLSNEVIHHKDGNGKNNSEDNLELMTRQAHARLHWDNGDYKRVPISKKGKEKLRDKQSNVTIDIAIRIKYKNELPKDLIKEFNISKFTISRIRTGKSWKDI